MKYETLEELAQAYADGELDDSTPLLLDNDCTFVWAGSDDGDEDEEKEGTVFDGGTPMDLLIEALDLLGIPNEGV